MSPEFWAIIGVGGVLWLTLLKLNGHLAESNRRLQTFWENIVDREIDRDEDY